MKKRRSRDLLKIVLKKEKGFRNEKDEDEDR